MDDKIEFTEDQMLSRTLPIVLIDGKRALAPSFPVKNLTVHFDMKQVQKAQKHCYFEGYQNICLNFSLTTTDKRLSNEDFTPLAMEVNESSCSILFVIEGYDQPFELSLIGLIPRLSGELD